jgi:hypothetical protein
MWGDDCAPHYIFAQMAKSKVPTLLVASPTAAGWRVRSTCRSYQHDYVSGETFEDVLEWVDAELQRPMVAHDRAEAREIIQQNVEIAGFLVPGGCAVADAAVDRVLRHLESGW